jgi:hypothetical protein
MDEKRIYTLEELGKILKLSALTLRRAVKAGKINVIRLGSGPKAQMRVTSAELDRILAGGMETTAPAPAQPEKPLPETDTKPITKNKKPKGS